MQANDFPVIGVASESRSFSDYLYIVSRLITGVLLLFAGISKLAPLHAIVFRRYLVIPMPVVLAWGVFELVVGWACLSLMPHRLLHRLVASMFVFFMLVLAVQWWDGEKRCNCMGSLDLPTTVDAGGTREIRLRLKGRTPNRVQRESAELLFDDSALRIVLNVTAIVRPN